MSCQLCFTCFPILMLNLRVQNEKKSTYNAVTTGKLCFSKTYMSFDLLSGPRSSLYNTVSLYVRYLMSTHCLNEKVARGAENLFTTARGQKKIAHP